MNKKFSTLVVACMASAAFSSAFAANITNASRTVTKIETEKAYQLSNADGSKILVMVPQGLYGRFSILILTVVLPALILHL